MIQYTPLVELLLDIHLCGTLLVNIMCLLCRVPLLLTVLHCCLSRPAVLLQPVGQSSPWDSLCRGSYRSFLLSAVQGHGPSN